MSCHIIHGFFIFYRYGIEVRIIALEANNGTVCFFFEDLKEFNIHSVDIECVWKNDDGIELGIVGKTDDVLLSDLREEVSPVWAGV